MIGIEIWRNRLTMEDPSEKGVRSYLKVRARQRSQVCLRSIRGRRRANRGRAESLA
jgi:hypothetical protein